ncbi:MAG: MBL fold metallo-hydrolase [Clostridiales bacterium]|jgi:L-ascorbate 6-phosphate lactonase|nr:MBL fold metallo-hydrolase [Clostridiales bacterium]HOB37263.1 MBL fold metallo-hydrolase [Candidatus Avimonas sp.]HQD38728.1 MBL fold metallo-hydrolase [Candidatus Avimonas sp.]
MLIRWIGQAGYVFKSQSTEIIIDPYLSDVVNKVANRPRLLPPPILPKDIRADAVVCTHNHLDHLDTEAIAGMDKEKILFIAPYDCVQKLKELGCKKILSLDEGQATWVGDFELTAVFADHTVPAIGIIAKCEDLILYFSGDTLYNDKLQDIRFFEPDVMFICINGKLGNMNVDEAVRLTEIINPRLAVPTHYGMFASNTEDPKKYLLRVNGGFEMEFNREYKLSKQGEKVLCSAI